MKTFTSLFVLLSSLFINSALAQNQSCTFDDGFSDFDFWVGSWDVFDTAGNLVGTNIIEKMEDGCFLQETWSGAGGSTGVSINYFNPVKNEWRQIWISAGQYAIDFSGGLQDGSMVLVGELYNYVGDETFDFRGTWSSNGDGSVRQFFEQYNNETEVWDVWFDGRYIPQ